MIVFLALSKYLGVLTLWWKTILMPNSPIDEFTKQIRKGKKTERTSDSNISLIRNVPDELYVNLY